MGKVRGLKAHGMVWPLYLRGQTPVRASELGTPIELQPRKREPREFGCLPLDSRLRGDNESLFVPEIS